MFNNEQQTPTETQCTKRPAGNADWQMSRNSRAERRGEERAGCR